MKKIISIGLASIALTMSIKCIAYVNNVPCALDTDCKILEYPDYLTIYNIEKADYQCYVKQTDLSDLHPIHTITIGNSRILAERDFGGSNGYEGNLYVPADKIYPNYSWTNKELIISAEQPRYSKYRWKPLSTLATITVHCKKIWSPGDGAVSGSEKP